MSRIFRACGTVITLSALMAISAVAAQAQTPRTNPANQTKRPAQSATVPAPSRTEKGTLSSFDAASNRVMITTSRGIETFTLMPSATLWHDKATLAKNDLKAQAGHQVMVQYHESGGQKMISRLEVEAANQQAAAKAATSTPAKK